MKFKGLLFDLDGTLVDSYESVMRSWRKWAQRNDLDVEHTLEFIHGKPAVDSITQLLPQATPELIEQECLWLEQTEVNDVEGVVALPGTLEFIQQLQQLDINWGIVTSGTEKVAHARVKAAGLPTPEVFITKDDVEQGKPNPRPYLMAMEQLGLTPSDCIVFEDAPAGVLAGVNAKMSVVGILSHFDADVLLQADRCVENLSQISLEGRDSLVFK
ncbi:putative phosphatase yfbT [Vibrio ishigakensis]|uniref:Putative phosphatase yfbT n=1 Tax=Vibrio ishigakensis TaxID=1481914 RepID=A0A0B8P6Q7_9VIBR|nr:putative phosphatase yfbT [Vibrio ishigakensis]